MVDEKRCDLTSSLKMLRPDDVWQPRMGAPRGNHNRLVHGNQTGEVKELRRLIAQWRRETAVLLAQAALQFALPVEPALPSARLPKNIHNLALGQSCIVRSPR